MSTSTVPGSRQRTNRDRGRGHITNRGGYGNTNSHRRDAPDNETSSVSSAPVTGVFRDSRTAVMLCTVLGARTSVKTRNGKLYKGLTTGFSAEGDIALQDAKLESDENSQDSNMSGIVIPRDNFVVFKAPGVDCKGLAVGSSDFTDSGIISRQNGSADVPMKALQPWEDDDVETTTPLMLDENQKGWEPSEMFLVNSEKFNVQSSYSEDLDGYTTPKVAPNSEGYEERARYAARQAEEIEKSEVYRDRVAKELSESSEEAKFASVNETFNMRSYDNHGGKNAYNFPAMRDGDQNMRNSNNTGRGQGRTPQRQNSPYSSHSANHSQSHPNAHPIHNSRHHVNNHYHQGPPPPSRNQGPPHRQQQQSPSHLHHQSAPHSMQQQQQQQQQQPPLPSQPPAQPQSQQQRASSSSMSSSSQQQQLVSTVPKVHPSVPVTHPPQSVSKVGHPSQQNPVVSSKGGQLNSPQTVPVSSSRPPVPPQHVNGDLQPSQSEVNAMSQKTSKLDVSSTAALRQEVPSLTKPNPPSASQSSVASRATETSAIPASSSADSMTHSVTNPSPASSQAVSAHERRSGRSLENNLGEARTKVNKQLQDFSKKFVLENKSSTSEPSRTEVAENSDESSSSGVVLSSASPSSTNESLSTEQSSATTSKAPEKSEENSLSSSTTGIVSNLNPLAKEFTPAAAKTPTPVAEAPSPSPSPQQRVSPHIVPQMMAYASPIFGIIPPAMAAQLPVSLPPRNKQASVSVGRASDLAAHHVTGQPLLATGHQMVYMPPNQSAGYQVLNMGNHPSRMVSPGSFPMPQTGQPGPLDPSNPQAQPQPVFLTGQQQPIHGPMPAHLTQHPQPAHAQPLPNPSSNTPAQPAHVPNPAPSPVQHHAAQQQTAQQYGGQHMPHHISQGPAQSATPQPSHYPPMSIHHGLQTMPRTSMAGQHGMAQSGHPSVSISYPMSTPHTYHSASPAPGTFPAAAQPQTSQNSNHNTGGHQPHYVVMPHPPPHQPMQQQHHNQAYTATNIQFQSGHNIVQGPSQMPPGHTQNPNQGAPHLIHPGMPAMPAGIHQQVPGTPSGMFMQVPSTLQQFQHPQ